MSQRMNVRLSHLTALAVMIALVGAMFVSLQPALAATGDIEATSGFCVQTDDETFKNDLDEDNTADTMYVVFSAPTAAASSDASVVSVDSPTEDDDEAKTYIPCAAALAGSAVNISPDGTDTPTVTLAAPTLLIQVLESDRILEDGADDLRVNVLALNVVQFTHDTTADPVPAVTSEVADATSDLTLNFMRTSGELDDPTEIADFELDGTTVRDLSTANNTTWTALGNARRRAFTLAIPKGTTPGEYTISAEIEYDPNSNPTTADENADDVMKLDGSATITIGEAGDAVASADLSLGDSKQDDPKTFKFVSTPETGSAPAQGGDIWLKLVTKNSLGNATNSGDVRRVIVNGAGGTFELFTPASSGDFRGKVIGEDGKTVVGSPVATTNTEGGNDSISADADGSAATLFVRVTKLDRKPGTVSVKAIVIGRAGTAESEIVDLNFGGPGATIDLGDAKAVAPGSKTEFSITALDSAGNPSGHSTLTPVVTGPDGKRATLVTAAQGLVGDSTDTILDDNDKVQAIIVTAANTAKAGVYTIDVSIAGVAASKASTTVTVSGTPSEVTLAADPETGDAAELTSIKVTATVTDDNDAPAVDGTLVEFSVLGTNLAAAGPGHAPITTETSKQLVQTNTHETTKEPVYAERTLTTTMGGAKVKDGSVTVTFIATGSGTAVVTATTEGGTASNSIRITTTDSAAVTEDAMPEEEASVSCLSELSGFATWSCGVEADASEIFDMVSGRGVTALHLWNGSTWVRYSVVDGAMVPGSSDFMVTKSDILYISN